MATAPANRRRSPARQRINRARFFHHHLAKAVVEEAAKQDAKANLNAAKSAIEEAKLKAKGARQAISIASTNFNEAAEEIRKAEMKVLDDIKVKQGRKGWVVIDWKLGKKNRKKIKAYARGAGFRV